MMSERKQRAWKRPKAPPSTVPGVFVYVAQHEETGEVKIGISARPSERVKMLRRRTILLAAMHGDHRRESQLHQRFKKDRAWGEWFRCSPEVQAWIYSLNGVREDVA